jgi:hypothetical protein
VFRPSTGRTRRTPPRLIDMGAPSYMVATSIHALSRSAWCAWFETCGVDVEPDAEESAGGKRSAAEPGRRYRRRLLPLQRHRLHGPDRRLLMLRTSDLVRAANIADPNAFLEAARPHLKAAPS